MFKLGKKSVIWRWIVSYVCIILISTVSNLVTYYRSQTIIKERQQKINEVVLEQASDQMHDCIVMMENLREELLTNTNYTALNQSILSRYSSTTYKQYLLYTDLNTYLKLNNSYSHIMLFFQNDDKIIADNSVNSSEAYWKIYHDSMLGLSYEQWNLMIHDTYGNFDAVNITAGNTKGTIFSRTIQTDQPERQKVNLFVFYSNEDWEDLLGKYQSNDGTSMLILDRYVNSIIFDYASLSINQEEEQLILEAIRLGNNEVTFRENEVLHLDYKENSSACLICILTPESIYWETVNQFQVLFNFIFFITILFSIILIGMFVRKNYMPVKDLLKSLAPNDMLQSLQKEESLFKNENEFVIVSKGMAQVKDNYHNVNIALKRQNKLLQKVYLSRLLFGGTNILPEKELKEIYDICFIYNDFVVVLFFVEDFIDDSIDEVKLDELEIIDLDHAQFILVNVYSDLVTSMGWIANHTKMDDILALIISFPPGENHESQLDEVMRNGRKEILASCNLEYSTTISNIHGDLRQLALAYQEALQALEAKKLYDLDHEVHYKEIAELSGSSYTYPYELEQDLIRYIHLNNFDSAKSVFEKVIQDNINSQKMVSHDILRCLMFDLLGTVMKTFDGKNESQIFIKQLRPAKRLSECKDLQSMKEVIEDILAKSCEYFNVGLVSGEHELLCAQIQEYVYKNYQNANLFVTSIASHFSMSPVDMSKIFTAARANPDTYGTEFDLAAANFPVLNKGQMVMYGGASYDYATTSKASAVVTADCKNPEIAVKFLNFCYSQTGHYAISFGQEGKSYTMVDGKPVYTDIVMKNPEGMSIAVGMAHWGRGNMSGAFVQDPNYILQYYVEPQQKEALRMWNDESDSQKTLIPPITMSPEESKRFAALNGEVDTFMKEQRARFFTLEGDITAEWDAYVKTLKDMGIEEMISIYQTALDRDNAR